jgi:hypothetical protein
LRRVPDTQPAVKLDAITHTHIFGQTQTRTAAARRARAEIGAGSAKDLLCDGLQDISRLDRPEELAWQDWPGARISPKKILGEGLMAGTAWQCVLAWQALRERHYSAAVVSAVGCNQQAIAARFALPTPTEI